MATNNSTYKPQYTVAEIDEAFEWFSQNMDRLPATLKLSEGIEIPDVRQTVDRMLFHLHQRVKNNNIYSGQFSLLLEIRKAVLQQS